MSLRRTLVQLSQLGIVVLAGFIAIGCVIEDPKAIKDIAKARSAIDQARKDGKDKDFPDKFVEFEKRYLQARGTFYACQDAQASQLAESIIRDINGLGKVAAPPAGNKQCVAQVTGPAQGKVDEALAFDASGSSDPDGDALTYSWDFGDGTPVAKFTFPRTTHRYAKAGDYTVKVMMDDGRGGTCSATTAVRVQREFVLRGKGPVLFDYNKAVLKPAAIQALAPVVKELQEQPNLRATIIGHTDSDGSDEYNMRLSKQRADAVRNYLVSKGIAASRLTSEGRGEREPEASNATAEGKALNRRVVITITPGN